MFQQGEYEGKYSLFDERGVPSHDASGVELNKSQKKKHEKFFAAQKKKFEKYSERPAADLVGGQLTEPAPPLEEATPEEKATEELPCPLRIVQGTFGNRQGYEVKSNMGPFTHNF